MMMGRVASGIVILSVLVSCRASQSDRARYSSEEMLVKPVPAVHSPLIQRNRPYPDLLKRQVMAVYQAKNRLKAANRASRGKELAQECLKNIAKQERRQERERPFKESVLAYQAPCAYYHIVLTGLYYKYHVLGYQSGLASMVDEAQALIALDPSYEDGGVYRVLGSIYLNAPSFSFKPKAILKDLDTAYTYAQSALTLAPQNPENLLLLAKILWEKQNYIDAHRYFKASLERLPRKNAYQKRERELMKEAKRYLDELSEHLPSAPSF